MDEITCCRYEDFARALADETRQAILELSRDQDLNVSETAAYFDLSQPTISHHLGLLRRAGVVLAQKKGRYVFYSVNRCCLTACARRLIAPFVESRSDSCEEP
jgi:ArsR family transcriptional regulator